MWEQLGEYKMSTTAQDINNSTANYESALIIANWLSVETEQDWENEQTEFTFSDDSKLVFNSQYYTSEIA